ncbi:MAG TPA: tetratricopeptide repeat protein [Bryobacteraceae bacterium]|jgi:tetratricopeptide (TPR) repeat protein
MAAPILLLSTLVFWQGGAFNPAELDRARDAQNRGALERLASQLSGPADKMPNDAQAQYRLALAQSYVAEVAMETGDKNAARAAAETGIKAAERATALKPDVAEYHRILGTLCGQVIPANVLVGLRYGHCAQDEVLKAVQLDPKAAANYVSRGVGNYYLPASLGGGFDVAIKDFQKAIELDPRSADAHLWLGLALRKANREGEAHKELQKAVDLNPARAWAKQQLAKTPGK